MLHNIQDSKLFNRFVNIFTMVKYNNLLFITGYVQSFLSRQATWKYYV